MKKAWSLKKRGLIITISIVFALTGVLVILIATILVKGFRDLETQTAGQNLKRVQAAYNLSLRDYEKKIFDWAVWDDSYKFITNLNPAYKQSNLTDASFVGLQTDEILYFDQTGNYRYASLSAEMRPKEKNFPEDIRNLLINNPTVVQGMTDGRFSSGLLKTQYGVLQYTGHQILRSDGTGTHNGYLIFGRYVGPWLSESLAEVTQLKVSVETQQSAPPKSNNAINIQDQAIVGSLWEPTKNSTEYVRLKFSAPRDIWNTGLKTMNYLLVFSLVMGFLGVLATYLFFYQIIIKDLTRLKDELTDITSNSGEGFVKEIGQNLEIDNLRQNINTLLTIVNDAKKQAESRASELDETNKLMTGREIRMAQMKRTIDDLKKRLV